MSMRRRTLSLAVVFVAMRASCATPVSPQQASIFRFESDEFWLNLHHFLYVLGRAEAKSRDSIRDAVAGVQADEQGRLGVLSSDEKTAWRDCVHGYAAGLSLKDVIFDDPLPTLSRSLAQAGDAVSLSGVTIEPDTRRILERAAPIYRKAWWPSHHEADQKWRTSMQPLIDQHGPAILQFIKKAYGMEWPDSGYSVHISAYSNWAGAYSTSGNLLVVSSAYEGTRGVNGLEIVFHESMHQWDNAMETLLDSRARRLGKNVPKNLSHALIFFTAGEAVRGAVPEHVPVADTFGVWNRGWMPLKSALDETWQPYLHGHGERNVALDALIAKTATD
jgi:hypothetical protein